MLFQEFYRPVDSCIASMGATRMCVMQASVSACLCVCMCRWCSRQLEKDSVKGAIRMQLALIASTLFRWAAALGEMTKRCTLGLVLGLLHPLLGLVGRQTGMRMGKVRLRTHLLLS